MNVVVGVVGGVALGLLIGLGLRGGRRKEHPPAATATEFTTPVDVPGGTPSFGGGAHRSVELPVRETEVTPQRHSLPEVREVAAANEILSPAQETQHRMIAVPDHITAAAETTVSPRTPTTVAEVSEPSAPEVAAFLTESDVLDRLTAVIDESRRQYARSADGAVRQTVGRDDITTNAIGEIVGIPSVERPQTAEQPHPASPASHQPTAPSVNTGTDSAPQPPPQSPATTPGDAPEPAAVTQDDAGPSGPAQISEPGAAKAPSADANTVVKTRALAWLIGDRHLAAWLPLTEGAPSHGALVTGILLAIAADGVINVIGTQQRTAAMHNTPPSPTLLANIVSPATAPRPAPPVSPPPRPAATPTAAAVPNTQAAPVPVNPSTSQPTIAVVPEAVAVTSPKVETALNQMAEQVRQATAAAAGPGAHSPEQVTKSAGDWAKAVQKGVSERFHALAKNVGKTANALRAAQATKAAGSNIAIEATTPTNKSVDESTGEEVKSDEYDLD
jgi:hypothetical protein